MSYRSVPNPSQLQVKSVLNSADVKGKSLRGKIKLLIDMGFASMMAIGGDLVDFEANRNDMHMAKISTTDMWSAHDLITFLKKHDLFAAYQALKKKCKVEHVRASSHQSMPSKPHIMDINTKRNTIRKSSNYLRVPDTYDTIALQQVTEPLRGLRNSSQTLKLHQIMKDCDELYSTTKQINTDFQALTASRARKKRPVMKRPKSLTQLELKRIQNLMKSLS
jgi:hypothetical protein